ncbi:formate dehydrogenase accessory sulfurtransferase FdhD [Albirhodobacter sp. R86504]|uniref:formate dehydrogenase accessory sulfurtransferase FdhD n=1 Tax=Albirhodobacter sp. R86504 TaxID=3093848 RepID=UPI00366AD6E7
MDVWRETGTGALAIEAPVALVFDGSTQAVMMASPSDLEDFALGFALTEGVIDGPDDVVRFEACEQELGLEARMWLKPELSARLNARRRAMLGPVGCGLCGIDSLKEALRPARLVGRTVTLGREDPSRAMASLRAAQPLQDATRAAHAAALWSAEGGLHVLREDIGRHNALDKLAGALARSAVGRLGQGGILVLTSRLSVDLVQKAGMIGAEVIVAAGAPTSLAVDEAARAGITLIGRTRDTSYEIYTHEFRIREAA